MDIARQYAAWEPNEETRAQMEALIAAGDADALAKINEPRIAFGTAGLRAAMGPGYARMNDLVVLQTAQGLCRYLEAQLGDAFKERGVAIGYDHRQLGAISSERFAKVTAAVFASQGCRVYLCQRLVATPILAWLTLEKNCAAGVMVTASHNPAADDGYKVYWGNGAQIIPPHDDGIAAAILDNLEPWQAYDIDGVCASDLVSDPTDETAALYYAKLQTLAHPAPEGQEVPRVVYTAMHGVGTPWVERSLEAFRLPPFVPVPEQVEADPTFPTVAYPNPEEGKGALALSFAAADAAGLDLILANDPDADRLAAAERQPGGEWHVFSGNEIGALLGYWEWQKWRAANPEGDASRVYMLASTVSSKFLGAVAAAEGFNFVETLTGFKWLGNKSAELRAEGNTVLFAYEEAIGFCIGDVVLDKDGVHAAAVFAEMNGALRAQGKSVMQQLTELYGRYGIFVANNHYFKCYEKPVIDAMFARIRTGFEGGAYPAALGGVAVSRVRDLTAYYDSAAADHVPDMARQSSNMITFTFENGCVATLRTSGTEPKIKYYCEMPGRPGQPREEISAELDALVAVIIEELLQPEQNNLEPPPSS